MPNRADLHVHTTASDGQYTPAQVVALARARGLAILAITDHDTTEGIAPAREAAAVPGSPFEQPRIIAGIELSAEELVPRPGGRPATVDVHMLGYFLNVADAAFQAALASFREDRESRASRMVEKLAALGAPVAWERVTALAGGGAVGRPHIARALVEAGHVDSTQQAFDRYLYTDGPAYVARRRMTPEGAVALIQQAGGCAVLAHPGQLADPRGMVLRLLRAGLDGVEIAHPSNTPALREDLRGLAHLHGLIMTGGSDFHGELLKPDNRLGDTPPPDDAIASLEACARQRQAGAADLQR